MSTAQAHRQSIDVSIDATHDPLAAAAATIAARTDGEDTAGTLIIVVRPGADDYRVIAGPNGNGTIRAAVAVIVAAENPRLWNDVDAEIVERSVVSLPEVVRAAAEGSGVDSVHVGVVRHDEQIAAVALWFQTGPDDTDADGRHGVLEQLDAAAERHADVVAERTAVEAVVRARREAEAPDPATATTGEAVRLAVGSDDPDIDALTGLASRARFDREVDEFEGDEATLLLIDLDHFAAINEEHGTDAGDLVLQEIAVRLATVCRKTDVVARLAADEFAILLNDVDRATGLQTSKRLLAAIAAPLPADIGPETVTATLAYSHEFGLVDMEELFENADEAIASAKRSARGHIVIAS